MKFDKNQILNEIVAWLILILTIITLIKIL